MNIILLGAPGAGKGSVSEKLIEECQMFQLSTGDLFRKNMSDNTALGQEAQKYLNLGKYVPDDVTNQMVAGFLAKKNNNLIFDGYPRTNAQAEALDEMLKTHNTKIDKVFLLEIDEQILTGRLTGRLVCSTCKRSYHKVTRKPQVEGICDFDGDSLVVRVDDAPDRIATRINEFNVLTAPLISYYEKQGKLIRIVAGEKSVSELFSEIKKDLN